MRILEKLGFIGRDELLALREQIEELERDNEELLSVLALKSARIAELESAQGDSNIGKQAYEQRLAGAKWKDCVGETPLNSAKAYARARNMPWPPTEQIQ
jgi:hypothetical protein